jgi:hypothetical protein
MVLTYRQRFNAKYGFPKDASHSLTEIAKLTGYKLSGLKTIQEKGEGAYFSNPQSVRPHIGSAEEWGRSRVYASVSPGSKSSKIDKAHLIKN